GWVGSRDGRCHRSGLMAHHVLAIDLGSTGVKAAIVDEEGTVRSSAGEVLPLLFTADGGAEQDPHGWWAAIGRCARRARTESGIDAADVTLVAITSQYTSTVAVAADGSPLANVVMWMDQRGRRHHPSIADPDTLPRWLEIHGMAPSGNDDIGHIAFIRAEWPEVYAAAAALVEPMDALCARLTGHVTATQSTVFPLGVIDDSTWNVTSYDEDLVELAGLDLDRLPPLIPLGEPRGTLTAAVAEHFGLSPAVVVMSGTIDSVTSAVGTGARLPTRCGLIIGTTSVVATHVASHRLDAAHGLVTAPSPLPDSWFIVAENGIGGKSLDVLVNNLIYPPDGLGPEAPDDAFELVTAAAAKMPAGANGVMFVPWLTGSGAPAFDRRVRGGFIGLDLTTDRADLARAVLEGVALNAAWLIPHVTALAGSADHSITLGGGGAATDTWGQILADVLGAEVRRLANPRTTNAHGAGLLALVEAGQLTWDDADAALVYQQVHEPDPANTARYAQMLTAFVDLHERLGPFFDILNHAPRLSTTPDITESP
ncbi:MAG: FGGY family carbohydrate kinase, partial [Ilumatobacteraceae bacterium]